MATSRDLSLAATELLLHSGELEPADFDEALRVWLGHGDDLAARYAAVYRAAEMLEAGARRERDAWDAEVRYHARTRERCREGVRLLLELRRELGEEPRIPGVASLAGDGGRRPLCIDTAAVPQAWCRVIVEPDTARIREALERGEEVPGARLDERGEHVLWARSGARRTRRVEQRASAQLEVVPSEARVLEGDALSACLDSLSPMEP